MSSMGKPNRFPSEFLHDKKMNAYMCTVWAVGTIVKENKEILLALFNTNPI